MKIIWLHMLAAWIAGWGSAAPAAAGGAANAGPAPNASAAELVPSATVVDMLAADGSLSLLAELQEPAASHAPAGEPWRWRITPYLWAAGIDGTFTLGAFQADADFEFSDIFDNLDGALMLVTEAHKGQFGIVVDGLYMDVEDDGHTQSGADADIQVDAWMLEGIGLYRLSPTSAFEIGAGIRYFDVETELEVGPLSLDGDRDTLDGVFAARATWPFARHWQAELYGDVGGGDADLTWQAVAAVGYDFNG